MSKSKTARDIWTLGQTINQKLGVITRMNNKNTAFVKFTDSDSLTHYGVLGMKWGVRKDRQGSGGTVTKKRLSPEKVNTAKSISNEGSNITSEGVRLTKAVGNIRSANKSVDLSKMTDDELKILVARMNLEQQYANIAGGQVTKGEVYTKNALEITGSVLAIGSSAMGIALAMHKLKGG